MKDLGVTISEDLSFSKHCDNIIEQAHSLCVLILELFLSHECNVYARALKC